jgi:uncharacterized protein (TIGR02646 family)
MRKVVKDFDKKPLSLTKQETLDHLKIIIESKDAKKIDSDFYRGKYEKEDGTKGDAVIEELNILYHSKCAYCEDYSTIYIEHYRPKGRVIKTKHGGYYWLCYEWSNLLSTCHECNKVGGGKSDQFPVKNAHQTLEDCLENGELNDDKINAVYLNQQEEPYLLHPEIDEPKDFFGFEIDSEKKGIAMKGLDGANGRGFYTVKICNLNQEDLLRKRYEGVIDQIKNDLRKMFALLSKGVISKTDFVKEIRDIFANLEKKSQNEKKTFTLLRWFVIDNENNFNDLIISQLKDPFQQNITLAYFKAYKNNKL